MRIIDAEPEIIRDLTDESKTVTSREHADFTVTAVRHPTLGKVVIIASRGGDGMIVEIEE